jgi:subtilisin family serine protease
VNWAIEKQCTIANMSLSSKNPLPQGTQFDAAFEGLAQNALKKGLLLVAASGNLSNRPMSVVPIGYPAYCPSVLAVGAIGQDRQIASFSNAGQYNPVNGQINFAAPGVNIASSYPTGLPFQNGFQPVPNFPNGYAFGSGTSMATPHVTGLAALLSEKLGGTGGLQLWQALALGSVDSLSTLSRTDVGFGMPLAAQS